MQRTTIGWVFVAVQAAVLIAVVALPERSDWPTPFPVELIGVALVVVGLAAMGLASLRLGTSLTPTPVPRAGGELTTTGLYRFVRHPIYSGLLTVIAGITIGSGSWFTLAVAAVALAFFHLKARWEEARLGEAYPGYEAYAEATPRFLPRPWRSRSMR